ncbi:CinA family nicotinamide mononucleotide deamidase-related protein [Photobacterium ganghwense]|uniref:CinA family nicotinamide mononucleotide deamidase-related protein n=1 Tax=Photobacterium ganghwense TaxID=320778 RepID=UPI0039F0AC2E
MLQVVMISTGEEVLHGDITDTNAAWLSRLFFEQGFAMTRRTTVGDQLDMLVKEIEHCSLTADVVIVNGGLGPTTDDLTNQAAAIAANVGLELSDSWVAAMQAKYAELGREMPETNLKQAMLPEGAEILDNPIGTACGFAMRLNRAWLFFTPGVPSEFKKMAHEQILPRLKKRFPENLAKDCHRLYTFGLSESGIGQTLQSLPLPEEFELGYRSALPFIEVKVFCPRLHPQAGTVKQAISERLGENVVSMDQPLLALLEEKLAATSYSLALAEQGTGGFVVNWLQEQPTLQMRLKQSWVFGESSGPADADCDLSDGEPLLDVESMAQAAAVQSGAQLVLASGKIRDGKIAVALLTPDGIWSQEVTTKRRYNHQSFRHVISTLMLDMLRRWLNAQPVFGHSESLQRLGSKVLQQSAQ